MTKKVKKMALGGQTAQTAQTAKPGTKPPTVMPAGMNPNFKGFGAGPTSFNAAKVNQVKGLLQGTPGVSNPTGGPLIKPPLVPPSTPKPILRPIGGLRPPDKATSGGPLVKPLSSVIRQPIGRMKNGGKVSSASKRADGCATRGKTRA